MVSENVWTYHNQINCDGVYLNFKYGQPNGGMAENCIFMPFDEGGQWRDGSCHQLEMHVMCKQHSK